MKKQPHLEVTAGQDGHPLFPLQYVNDAASTAHLCCQGGSDRLIGPASFPWISHGNGRSYLDFVMAWSWGCVQRRIQIDRKIKVCCCFSLSFLVLILTEMTHKNKKRGSTNRKVLSKLEKKMGSQMRTQQTRRKTCKSSLHTIQVRGFQWVPRGAAAHTALMLWPRAATVDEVKARFLARVFILYTSRFSPIGKRTNTSYCRLRQVNSIHWREHFKDGSVGPRCCSTEVGKNSDLKVMIAAHLAGGKLWWCAAAVAELSWPRCCHCQRWGQPRSGPGQPGPQGRGPVLWVEPPRSLWHSLWCPCPQPQGAGEHSVGGMKDGCACVRVKDWKVDILNKQQCVVVASFA